MPAYQAIILGIIQGLTEFIPVSSSGHLVAVPHLLGWNYQGKSFDAAVHLGTLAALVVYYRRDWSLIIADYVSHVFKKSSYAKGNAGGGRLLIPIMVACVPAAFIGALWNGFIENNLSRWEIVAVALVVFGILMLIADRTGRQNRSIAEMQYADFLIIGMAQAVALLPGVSRSGITIAAGLFRGLDRSSAAKFSFLLSTPIVFGAGIFGLKHMFSNGATTSASDATAFFWGFAAAAAAGYAAIHFLITYTQKGTLKPFVIYRVCLAAALAGVFLVK